MGHQPTDTFGCVNHTIRLRSGHYFDLADPRPDAFEFADIAGALSKVCRFGGQCPEFYSVAEHLWHCTMLAQEDGLTRDERVAVLLHDAAEAFVGDVVKPLKALLPEYAAVELAVERAVGERFGVDFAAHAEAVKKIDREVLIAERRAMFGDDGVKWTGEDSVRRVSLRPHHWVPARAEEEYTRLGRLLGVRVA